MGAVEVVVKQTAVVIASAVGAVNEIVEQTAVVIASVVVMVVVFFSLIVEIALAK